MSFWTVVFWLFVSWWAFCLVCWTAMLIWRHFHEEDK